MGERRAFSLRSGLPRARRRLLGWRLRESDRLRLLREYLIETGELKIAEKGSP